MPTPGLSLVGFMDQPNALNHLRRSCVPLPNAADADLIAVWQAAAAKLGTPIANCGTPEIKDAPASHHPYIDALTQLPWVVQSYPGQNFTRDHVKLIEVDPLLAFQFTVDLARSAHHCGQLTGPPTIDQLFACCLPMSQPSENYDYQLQGQSAIIKSRSLNLRVQVHGIIGGNIAGLIFGASLPIVQVVRFNGRLFLHNGFHRAVGMRRAGATHIPCLLRDVSDAETVGLRTDGATFSEALLTSTNPPCVGHFTQGRATDVQIRATSRILHVSWSDYVWPDE